MERNGIRNDVIYELKEQNDRDSAFVYVRGWKGDEVMFSVLDEPEKCPRFDNCGMFWIRPEDFLRVFRVSEYPRL